MKAKAKTKTLHNKRHGHHQRRSNKFNSIYFPYLPIAVILIISVFSGNLQTLRGTLAYATSMSHSNLLQATNNQRSKNGQSTLSVNQKLSTAAQKKAEDMAARNYWSHNTPDGDEPWVFIDSTGYKYQKAGENLAYGFLTSEETVVGWMNSPTHKENMLDGSFTEVGFGYVNSANFNESGEQTIVVAMYGKPATLAATNTSPAPAPVLASSAPKETKPTVAETKPEPTEAKQPAQDKIKLTANVAPQEITRVQAWTGGNAPWTLYATVMIVAGAILFMLLRHGLAFRHLIRDSENFVMHHPVLDATLISVIILGLLLSQTIGVIL